ncbi:MAG: molybdopterin-dependent oxidoreductase, partial [bacterium]|nr:molybdopterin-dependent oxidoreductase [bacterium]
MERRDFFKLVGTASGGALAGACGRKAEELLPVLVPEQAIVPGVEEWHPSVCRECPAGCGVIVRVMEARRRTEQNGEAVLEPVAAIKKVEGNPLDPVSGGRLCARGQASVQRLYHPDRLRGPKKRTGERGETSLVDVSWDEALDAVAARLKKADPKRIVYLSRPESGTRAASVERFLDALGAE